MPHSPRAPLSILLIAICAEVSGAYSVLTHEQIVDLLWKDRMRPMIEARYPGLTLDQIRQAHAYAYGGLAAPSPRSLGAEALIRSSL